FYLEERRSALTYLIESTTLQELSDPDSLSHIFLNLKRSFSGFVDLGLIDANGSQRAYAGPYDFTGLDYKEQDWFHEVILQDVYVSDVYLGYRNRPHFSIAVKHDNPNVPGDFYVLRATLMADILRKQIQSTGDGSSSDAFFVNQNGILQTPSRDFGSILDTTDVAVPSFSDRAQVTEHEDKEGKHCFLSYAHIAESPFIFMMIKHHESFSGDWLSFQGKLLIFLIASCVVILLLVTFTSHVLITLIREAEESHDKVTHKMEYQNKMASIGRLAAGVAHEINNPLAIINEKAGLLKDMTELSEDFPQKGRIESTVDSILSSVERCSTITHRLLGFARHMDLTHDTVDLKLSVKEVLGFLEKEAHYRNIEVKVYAPDTLPEIVTDKSQLQQVLLNIINNAFAAVDRGGLIEIAMFARNADKVTVSISDNGKGINKADLEHIFEPFFTTKKDAGGTGLGLSITYGIVQKLGGKIEVESEVGKGTAFHVTLPIQKA
ncbi:MAG: two-component sensor histidine kinase, partial [candidate division Zixibacteria bacterium]|nr:two-component sensor histidine kinase [candidate division Zixibacteria bacterium]